MSVELKSKENNKAVFTVEIQTEEFKNALGKAYQKNRHLFSIPGFRKGKAPRKIIELNYGKDVFYEDAVNIVLNEKYEPALDELKLEPIDYPEVDILDEVSSEKAFNVEFTVQIKPSAKLGDYKNLEVDVEKYEVTDEMVDAEVENERNKNARLVAVEDRESAMGDTVNIDFEGFIDDEAFEGGKAEGYELVLGSNSFIPGFEDQLVGRKAEDEFDVNVKFPEEYHDDLKGKDAVFKVKLNNIKVKELPELDDDFVMDVSEFDTVDEYKNNIKETLIEKNDKMFQEQKTVKATKALMEISEVEIPEIMIEKEIERLFKDHELRLQRMGMTLDSYYAATGSDEEKTRKELRKTAEELLARDFALEAFAEAENIEATDEEIDNEIRELAKVYSENDIEKFVKDYKAKENLNMITDFVVNRKTLDHLLEIVKFNIVDIDLKDQKSGDDCCGEDHCDCGEEHEDESCDSEQVEESKE